MKTKYTVHQTFERFGDPCREEFDTEEAAKQYADKLAGELAQAFFKQDGDNVIIEYVEDFQPAGYAEECDWFESLQEDSEADEDKPGNLPWSDLVSRIRDDAIEIEEEEIDED